MKNIMLAAMVAATGTMLMIAPAQAKSVAIHSGYCRHNIYDPICMDRAMMNQRKMMMSMTKAKAMANRSKYCRTNHDTDPICTKDMMNSTMGY